METVHLNLKFLEDVDDSIRIYEQKGIDMKSIPRVGECVCLNDYYHRVKGVVYDAIGMSVTLHLGQSAQSAEESRSKGYGLWNS